MIVENKIRCKNLGASVLDAIGKVPEAISAGNVMWVGRVDMCRRILAGTYDSPYDANYCVTYIGPFLAGVCFPKNCSADDLDVILGYGN